MSKICAKCEKPVYPLEELKCLDKIWHKGCFKCWECGMSLNMKNYKGFDRKPYCSAHYPQTKATVVADTPELQRLSQASKIQSQAKYHEEFEKKIKGSKIQVADDPETQRLKQLSSVVSQVEYKGLREKVLDMEAKRQNVSQPEVPEKSIRRPDNHSNESQKGSPYSERNFSHSTVYNADGRVEAQPQRKIGSIADYDPTNYSSTLPHSSLRQTQEWEETVVLSPQNFPSLPNPDPPSSTAGHHFSSLERPGGISSSVIGNADVKSCGGEAVTGGSAPAEDQQYLAQQQQQQQLLQQQNLREQQQQQQLREQQQQQQQLREQQQQQQLREQQQQQQLREQQQQQQLREQQQQVLREQQLQREQQQLRQQQQQQQQLREQQLQEQQRQQLQQDQYHVPYEQTAQRSHALTGAVFQAMYDYDAQDDDEVSFIENDFIINCDPIDEGWMYGTIKRTGLRGMLPANYVERVQ